VKKNQWLWTKRNSLAIIIAVNLAMNKGLEQPLMAMGYYLKAINFKTYGTGERDYFHTHREHLSDHQKVLIL
jgi:hypothetical protein